MLMILVILKTNKLEVPKLKEPTLIPCLNCIALVVCKHKTYLQLFDDCCMVRDYIPLYRHIHIRNEVKVKLLYSTLHPTVWKHDGVCRVIDV
jgi:hypothetical protein